MFCKNCGTENLDTARFCVGCGTDLTAAAAEPVYEAPVEEPVYQEPIYQEPVYQEPAAPEEETNVLNQAFDKAATFGKTYVEEAKKDKKKLLIPIIAVAATLTLIFAFVMLFGKPYKSALNNEFKYYAGKATEKTIEKSQPKEYWEYVDDELDITPADRFESYEEYYLDGTLEKLEDEYGDNIRFSYKILEQDKLSDSKLNDLKDDAKDSGLTKKNLTKAYKVKLEVTVKGSEDKDTFKATAYVYKYKGSWYVYDIDMSKMYAKI